MSVFYKRHFLCSVISFSISCGSAAKLSNESSWVSVMRQNAPSDFQQLFEPIPEVATIKLPNGLTQPIDVLMSAYHVRMSGQSTEQLRQFLEDSDVSADVIKEILNALSEGIDSAPCKGNRQTCSVVLNKDEHFAFVINDAEKQIRLFLSPEAFTQRTGNIEYKSAYNPNPAFINTPTLYSSYFGQGWSLNVNNKSVIGLPFGNIRSELYSTSTHGRVNNSVQTLVYDVETGPARIIAGRSNDFSTLNSTSLLSFLSRQMEGAYIISSRNLALREQNSYQRLYYYMPQPGAVEVWRDDKLIYSAPSEPGQGFISYDKLPRGNYNVIIKTKSGNATISEQPEHIINTNDFTLNTGGVDYLVGTGRISNQNTSDTASQLTEANIAWHPWSSTLFASGVTWSEVDTMYKIAGKWLPVPGTELSFGGAFFSDKSRYYQTTARFNYLTLSWSRFSVGSSHSINDTWKEHPVISRNLAGISFGDSDYEQLMLSTSYSIGSGNGYATIFHQKNQYNQKSSGKSIGYNIGYSTPFIGNSYLSANLSFNNMQSHYTGNRTRQDTWSGSINISIPLGGKLSTQLSSSADKSNNISSDVALQYSTQLNHKSSGSLSIGRHQGKHEKYNRLSGSFNTRQQAFTLQGNAAFQSQGTGKNSLFASLGGTQIVNAQGIWFTNSQANSYLIIDDSTATSLQKQNGRPQAQLTVGYGGSGRNISTTDYYASGSSTVIPLTSYKSYNARLNSAAFGVHNAYRDQVSGYSYPGSTIFLSTNFQKEFQLIGYFENSFGKPINNLTCNGESCLRIEKLDEGLFKVLLKGVDGFSLSADSQRCVNNDDVKLSMYLTRLDKVTCVPITKNNGQSFLAIEQFDGVPVVSR
ncbi:hypothetical protein CWG93_18930 [Salmonella enterica subsp. enterica serovar Sandiego]|nr:hypothetical protein [Salmonella enterica subsp. enterica serovar Sandiego]